MNRRAFVAGWLGLIAAPFHAKAQSAGRVFRIGWLTTTWAEFVPERDNTQRAFAEGLRALGYVIGQNVMVELRSTEGHPERLTTVATELARSNPDVIFAPTTLLAQAAAAATSSIPIVFCFAADPVRDGLIDQAGQRQPYRSRNPDLRYPS
jgi:putative ABC transport system substrate-binding protein